MMFTDLLRALGQIGDRRFRGVIAKGVGLALALLIAVYAAFIWIVGTFAPETLSLPVIGEVAWVDDLLSVASVLLMMALSVFLMVPVAAAFTGLFLEDVADAVEERHYPELPPTPRLPILEGLRDAVGFLGLLVVANIVAIFLYIMIPPAAPLIFWALNGFLLGQEYFQLVAMRRIGREGARALRRQHAVQVWVAGLLMAVPLSVPVLNLVIPVLGVATFTHMFVRLAGRAGALQP